MSFEVNLKDNGTGRLAGVTDDYQLQTRAEFLPLQHYNSFYKGKTYQVIGTATEAVGATTVLHVKNTDPERFLVCSYIRLQTVDLGVTAPAAGAYWEMGFGRTVSSGGTTVTPVNMNRDSGGVALVTATNDGPTMSGSFIEVDRYYPQSEADAVKFNKDGSLILGLNDTFEIRFTSTGSGGTAYARMTFFEVNKDRLGNN